MDSCSSNIRRNVQKHSEIRQFSQQDIHHFYKLGQVIGRGNFATVQIGYKIELEKNGLKGKCYAIKCIDKERISLEQIQMSQKFYQDLIIQILLEFTKNMKIQITFILLWSIEEILKLIEYTVKVENSYNKSQNMEH